MDAFTVLFSTVKYIFVLYLENPKKAGDPWDYALVRGKKSANWACNWKHWIHQLWWVRLVRGWKWSPETLRVPCEKNPWERSALAKVKRSLDDAALERLSPRARANFLPRRGHTHQSDRQRPLDSLDWAVRPPPASTPASNQPISSRAAETPLSSRSRAAETPLPSTRTATPVQTLTTASRLTPVGLTSSGTQPVTITRPKQKACRMTTSPEF